MIITYFYRLLPSFAAAPAKISQSLWCVGWEWCEVVPPLHAPPLPLCPASRHAPHPRVVSSLKIAGWGSYHPHPVHPAGVGHVQHPALPMKFHDGGGGVMAGYHHHNLMDMYPGPAINTMDWKNTSQVGTTVPRPTLGLSSLTFCSCPGRPPPDRGANEGKKCHSNSLGFRRLCAMGALVIWSLTYAVAVNDLWSLYLQVNHSWKLQKRSKLHNKLWSISSVAFLNCN